MIEKYDNKYIFSINRSSILDQIEFTRRWTLLCGNSRN